MTKFLQYANIQLLRMTSSKILTSLHGQKLLRLASFKDIEIKKKKRKCVICVILFFAFVNHLITLDITTIPAGMDASPMHLWDVSCSISETSQRGLICKSLRRLRWDVLKTSPQRRLWYLSGLLRDVFELRLGL